MKKYVPYGQYEWHGVMIVDGEAMQFVIFDDTFEGAVKNFNTLPSHAVVIKLERGEDVSNLEFDAPAIRNIN